MDTREIGTTEIVLTQREHTGWASDFFNSIIMHHHGDGSVWWERDEYEKSRISGAKRVFSGEYNMDQNDALRVLREHGWSITLGADGNPKSWRHDHKRALEELDAMDK